MKTLFLCGAGNSEGVRLALNINREGRRWERIVLLDDDPAKHGQNLLGVEIAGSFDELAKVDPATSEVASLVARTTKGRVAARQRILGFGVPFASLVSPDVDCLGATLPGDVMVYQNATIGPEVSIGEGSVVFMGGVVGHESRLGPGCVVASNAVINARVVMEQGVYLGPNATVIYEIQIGEWATIGAGSAVIHDVPAGTTVIGVPGEVLATGGSSVPMDDSAIPVAREAPSNTVEAELEEAIAGVWARVLRVPKVDAWENFFDAGGTSLLALQARQQIEQTTMLELSNTDIFRFPTVRALARHLSAQKGAAGRAEGAGLERGRARRQAMARRRRATVH